MKLIALTLALLLGVSIAVRAPVTVRQLPPLPPSCPTDFRTIDGTCNNVRDAGAAGTGQRFIRRGGGNDLEERAGARVISNTVMNQLRDVRNDRGMSELVTFFGQFIDHNIVETPVDTTRPSPIPVPSDDPAFASQGPELTFSRSVTVRNAPLNTVTSFIDASAVYGSDNERAEALRTLVDGKLKVGPDNLLPDNEEGIENAPSTGAEFFVAGDIRSNENPMLTALHTLFVREHNLIADEVRAAFPNLNDEEIFLRARKINAAQLQRITYEEWLPALLGDNGVPPFTNSDPSVRPVTSVFFSTAAFRVGHTLLNNEVTVLGPQNRPLPGVNLLLQDVFQTSNFVRENGIEPFVRGMANTLAQEVDTQIVDSLRNFLFSGAAQQFPDLEGFDLAARNIQRGRDHGIIDYNRARRNFGLPVRRSISEISSDPAVVQNLEAVYTDVNNIDAWVGALAEDRVPGSSLGELLRASWIEEFTILRDGDRFFYLVDPELAALRPTFPRVEALFGSGGSVMRDIILRTTDIAPGDIPANPFFA